MYSDIDSITALTLAPPGKALVARGGFNVNGRWPFGSGCQNASWLIGHFAIFDGDAPRLDSNGLPETRLGFLPAEESEIVDTWTTTGLRGTGSHDWMVKDRFIPEAHTFNLAAPTIYRAGPLYALPNLIIYKVCAVALGIARGALFDFASMASYKAPTFNSSSAKATLRDEVLVQHAVARAEALVSAARAFVFEAFGDMWETLVSGNLPSLNQRARARLAMVHASTECTEAVGLLFKASGGSSVYAGNALNRRLRDIQTANQSTAVSLKTWEIMGTRAAWARAKLRFTVLTNWHWHASLDRRRGNDTAPVYLLTICRGEKTEDSVCRSNAGQRPKAVQSSDAALSAEERNLMGVPR
jgi:indole-3-acetate monooxygenase